MYLSLRAGTDLKPLGKGAWGGAFMLRYSGVIFRAASICIISFRFDAKPSVTVSVLSFRIVPRDNLLIRTLSPPADLAFDSSFISKYSSLYDGVVMYGVISFHIAVSKESTSLFSALVSISSIILRCV